MSRYYDGLVKRFPEREIHLVYLTPFNADHAGDKAQSLPTVREFERFKTARPDVRHARHVSWLDVARISWEGNALWRQHQDYVNRKISSETHLREAKEQNRSIAHFFGKEAAAKFLKSLERVSSSKSNDRLHIDLSRQDNLNMVARTLARAITSLLESPSVVQRESPDDFANALRRRFLRHRASEIHRTLFEFSNKHANVWIQGKGDYGVRIAHANHPGGVSVIRSGGPDRLVVYLKR